MSFIKEYHEAIPVLAQILGSKNISDVLESIEFFVTAFEFGMTSAMIGIRKMLVLVWSREAGIKVSMHSQHLLALNVWSSPTVRLHRCCSSFQDLLNGQLPDLFEMSVCIQPSERIVDNMVFIN